MSYDRLVEVIAYIPSDSDGNHRDRAERTLGLLPTLHAALATVDPRKLPEPDYSAFADAPMALAMLDDTELAFGQCCGHDGFEDAVEVRRRTRTIIERIDESWDRVNVHLPCQCVHGDVKYGNVLFAGQDVVGIIDFDFMAVRTRIFDLAYVLFHCLVLLRTNEVIGDDESSWLTRQVASYAAATHLPMTSHELAALPYEMALVGLYQVAEAGYVADDPSRAITQTRSVARHIDVIEWLAANAASLHDRFTGAIEQTTGEHRDPCPHT